MTAKEQKKQAIIAAMIMGGDANKLGEAYNVSPIAISSWMRQAGKEAEKDKAVNLKDIDPVALEIVTKEIKRKASNNPSITTDQLDKLEKGIDDIRTGVAGLQILEIKFHDTIMNLLKIANSKITDDMKISEWNTLVNGITSLHSTIFNKGSQTNINMLQQNNGGGQSSAKVDLFKGGFRR